MSEAGFSAVNRNYDEGLQVGFKVFFENGYGISFIFGGESNSDEMKIKKFGQSCDYFAKTAEVAVLNEKGELVPFNKDGAIKSYVKPEEIGQIISWTMNR
jgi:hypothetical protein